MRERLLAAVAACVQREDSFARPAPSFNP